MLYMMYIPTWKTSVLKMNKYLFLRLLQGHSDDPQIQEWIEKEVGWGGPHPPDYDAAYDVVKVLRFR